MKLKDLTISDLDAILDYYQCKVESLEDRMPEIESLLHFAKKVAAPIDIIQKTQKACDLAKRMLKMAEARRNEAAVTLVDKFDTVEWKTADAVDNNLEDDLTKAAEDSREALAREMNKHHRRFDPSMFR